LEEIVMSIRPFACAALVLSLGACAPGMEAAADGDARASSPRQCFQGSLVRNFRADGPGAVYVRANDNTVYELNTGGCPGVDFTNALGITSDTPIGNRLCVGDHARVTVPGSAAVCRARVSKALTAEEVAALPDRVRP
jgi:hypothetical protein